MLGAAVEDLGTLQYPLLASPKYDGIRAIWWNGRFYSRNLKHIPNVALSERMAKHLAKHDCSCDGMEGELIYGEPVGEGVFNRTSSKVMTRNADADGVKFYMFDDMNRPTAPFYDRWGKLPDLGGFTVKVPHVMCHTAKSAEEFENLAVDEGYEGMILRAPEASYKCGRSTLREQGLLKVKRFMDAEAQVVGFEELMHNANPLGTNELGYAHRTSHKAGQVPSGTLGTLLVAWNGQVLGIGSGFTAAERVDTWNNREFLKGKWVKFKYLPAVKDLPRHPVFLGWREEGDR